VVNQTSVASAFPALVKAQYISLVTFRKSGVGVPTPVWFVEHDGKLYVQTEPPAGKLKRIRNNGRVTVAACNAMGKVSGPVTEAHAAILTDAAKITLAESMLAKKYGLLRIGFNMMLSLNAAIRRHPHPGRAYIVIETNR